MENLQKPKLAIETNKDILMFQQTTIRNVALTTAVSFAALGYSRFYRGKSLLYSGGLVFVSILLVLISLTLNVTHYNIIVEHNNLNEKLFAGKEFFPINYIFLIVNILTLFFALYTLYRLLTNNKFD